MYTEEVHEARNKDSKRIRLHHTRKMSRTVTLTDRFNQLLETSNLIISSFTFQKTKKIKKPLPKNSGLKIDQLLTIMSQSQLK